MAKARPVTPVRDRAIAAFKRALPSCEHCIKTYKVRSKQIIRVEGADIAGNFFRLAWSYGNNGALRRVDA